MCYKSYIKGCDFLKIVVLDSYALNPGDLSWEWLEKLGDCEIHYRTPQEKILERCEGADIILTNKTPLTKETLSKLNNLKYIALLSTGYNIVDWEYAKEIGAKLVLATDPDADRLGMGVFHDGEFHLLNGNQSAAIMVDYICSQLKAQGRLPQNGWVFSTNVSSELPLKIAKKYGLNTYVSLTGFKFIGEQAERMEHEGGEYVFGFEESYGCLIKDFVRDKDAIQAILMICEIEAWCESQGKDLFDYLHDIYEREGFTYETQENIYLRGLDGKKKIREIMDSFRNAELNLKFGEIIRKEDNYTKVAYEYLTDKVVTSTIDLPQSNVLKYNFNEGSWFVLRPSGTEPKLKIYFATVGKDKSEAINKNIKLKQEIMKLIEKLG